jgi:putative intracellular protease/amidase
VACDNTLVIHPHHSFASVPALDVLVHPGGDGHIAMLEDEAHLAWLREQKARVPLMTSVCTGSVVYAAAGLLRGRPATSNRKSLDIDMALHVVGRLAGPERSRAVREGIEYAPDPPQ